LEHAATILISYNVGRMTKTEIAVCTV
jgi:hypothetical protein